MGPTDDTRTFRVESTAVMFSPCIEGVDRRKRTDAAGVVSSASDHMIRRHARHPEARELPFARDSAAKCASSEERMPPSTFRCRRYLSERALVTNTDVLSACSSSRYPKRMPPVNCPSLSLRK